MKLIHNSTSNLPFSLFLLLRILLIRSIQSQIVESGSSVLVKQVVQATVRTEDQETGCSFNSLQGSFVTQLLNLVPHPWASLWEENWLMRKGLHLVQDFILSERAQVKYLQETLAFLASSPIFLISFSPLLPAAPSFSPL